jgi:hypothetical protein
MAYFNQERKKAMAPKIKEILKKYGLKGSLAVRHHSTVVLNIRSGEIDFISNFNECGRVKARDSYQAKGNIDVNVYWYKEHFAGRALMCLEELIPVLNQGNHNRSDIQSDYFDVGWYVDVNIGTWDKPYILEGAMA